MLNVNAEAEKVLLEHHRYMSKLMAMRIFSNEILITRNDQL